MPDTTARITVRKFHADGSESGMSALSASGWAEEFVGVMEPGDVVIVSVVAAGAASTVCPRCVGTKRLLVTPGNRDDPPSDQPDLGPPSAGAVECYACEDAE